MLSALTRFRMAVLLVLLCTNGALAQNAPVSPDHPWNSSAELTIKAEARSLPGLRVDLDQNKTYSLPELIDFAEADNPQTHVAWERALAQAAALGVARSELFPTLSAAAISQTSRSEPFFGQFYKQVTQDFQLEFELNYTVFDFGARSSRINAVRAQLLATNFAFNDTHRNVIYQVQTAYYRVLSSMGQVDAARANLTNAQAVQQAAEDRLANGLATMPDVLEARSATAQADYELQAALGAEEIARGYLATAVGAPATTAIRVQPLDQVPTRESLGETVEQVIDRALGERPDLIEQLAEIRSANARAKEARAAYFPTLSLSANSAIPSLYGLQQPAPWAHTSDLTGGVSLNLNWTVFDGGARKNRLAQATADVHGAEAQANVKRNQIADEVWTAYSNLNTAFRQRQAAIALLEAASQSYSAALESYNYGVRNLLDVTAAQRTLAQARSSDVLSRTQVLNALAELAYRTGDSIQASQRRPRP